ATSPITVHVKLAGSTARYDEATTGGILCPVYTGDFDGFDFSMSIQYSPATDDATIILQPGQAAISITPHADYECEGTESVVMTIKNDPAVPATYSVAAAPNNTATIFIDDNPSAHGYPTTTPGAS